MDQRDSESFVEIAQHCNCKSILELIEITGGRYKEKGALFQNARMSMRRLERGCRNGSGVGVYLPRRPHKEGVPRLGS